MPLEKNVTASSSSSDLVDSPSKGIVLVIAGMFFFSLHDTIVKWISGDYPAHEIVFFRSFFALLPILMIGYRDGGMSTLKTNRPFFHIIRGFCWFVAFSFFYLAIAALPLAESYALFFSAPLFITMFSVLLLGERVASQKWIAISAGFLGVLLIMRPAARLFNPAAIFAVLSAMTYAISVVLTRRLGKTDSGVAMAFYTTIIYLFGSSVVGIVLGNGHFATGKPATLQFMLRAWVMPDLRDFGLMALCGLMAGLGFYALSQAYRLTQATTIAHYEYTAVPFSILWGFLIWRDIPDIQTLAGMILVVGGGIYIVRREIAKKQKPVVKRTNPAGQNRLNVASLKKRGAKTHKR